MKYTVSIEIAQPRERVVELLADPDQLPKWLRGLVLHEPLNGLHGQVGTTSRVVLEWGSRRWRPPRPSRAGNPRTCTGLRAPAWFTSTANSSRRACGAPRGSG